MNPFFWRYLIAGPLITICVVGIIATALFGPNSYDAYWHLKMGADWVERDLSPWVDHYSFTYQGHPIVNPPFIFQWLLHYAVKFFGLDFGMDFLLLSGYLMTLGATAFLLRKIGANVLIYIVVLPLVAYLLQFRGLLRPEVFSYFFSILGLWLYFDARGKVSWRKVIPVILLMWFWSIYHSSIIGYVIFAGFYLDCALNQIREKASLRGWLVWLLSGFAVLAVSFINPSLESPLLNAVQIDPQYYRLITEYLPSLPALKQRPGGISLIVLAVVFPVLALYQRKLGYFLIWAVTVSTTANVIRMVTPAGIVLVLLMAKMLVDAGFSYQWSAGGKRLVSRMTLILVHICIVYAVFGSILLARNHYYLGKQHAYRFPVALVEYFKDQGMRGKIFNDYRIGGYLINELAPDSRVYIDGRTDILYPAEHLAKWKKANSDPEILRGELVSHSVDYVIALFPNSFEAVYQAGGFQMDFVDSRFALFTKKQGRLQGLAKLYHDPACWARTDKGQLLSEYEYLRLKTPQYSAVRPFADLVVGFVRSSGGRAYFDSQIDQQKWSDAMRRFAAYRMMSMQEYAVSTILFGSVEQKKITDYLAATTSMIEQGRFDTAIQVISQITQDGTAGLSAHESLILLGLLERMKDEGLLDSRLLKLAGELSQSSGPQKSDSPQTLDENVFCSDYDVQVVRD